MDKDKIRKLDKEKLYEPSLELSKDDIKELVTYLDEKDDDIRYKSLLLLEYVTEERNDVYDYFDVMVSKLEDSNSYQKMIGMNLISRLTKWDNKDKIVKVMDLYFEMLNDEKPMVIRLCIQNLKYIVMYKEKLIDEIINRLVSLDISSIRETMRKGIVSDIFDIFKIISKDKDDIRINKYYNDILNGSIFDEKVKKELRKIIENN